MKKKPWSSCGMNDVGRIFPRPPASAVKATSTTSATHDLADQEAAGTDVARLRRFEAAIEAAEEPSEQPAARVLRPGTEDQRAERGAQVSALNAEIRTENAMVSANCR